VWERLNTTGSEKYIERLRSGEDRELTYFPPASARTGTALACPRKAHISLTNMSNMT